MIKLVKMKASVVMFACILEAHLKVVCNEKQGGSGRWYTFGWYRIVAIDVLWAFNFAVVFILMYICCCQVNQN
jgi:hypothetical protein